MILLLILNIAFAQINPMIVGGEDAKQNEFPFNASLRDNRIGHFCGGSLIKPNMVLTAAHCVGEGVDYVVIGANKVNENLESFLVKTIKTHPKWNPSNYDYDFALIELNGKSKAKPVELTDKKRILKTDIAEIIGFGYTKENGQLSVKLQKANVPLVSKADCDKAYPNKITPQMLCAGLPQGGVDTCQGDSGGALLLNGKLAGVTSWGYGCARPNKYGVYSRVSSALSWIQGL